MKSILFTRDWQVDKIEVEYCGRINIFSNAGNHMGVFKEGKSSSHFEK